MKKLILIAFGLVLAVSAIVSGQTYYNGYRMRYEIIGNDTMPVFELAPVPVFRSKVEKRRNTRLINNIKRVYPIAKEANAILKEMERHIATLETEKEKADYTKEMEKYLKKKYTPVIRQLTFSQGKILIKLIDRETSHTSYALLQELRGNFSAFLWQGVAQMFGANLKDTYDKDGDDRLIEMYIILYEHGLL